jgi:hypothetical protein
MSNGSRNLSLRFFFHGLGNSNACTGLCILFFSAFPCFRVGFNSMPSSVTVHLHYCQRKKTRLTGWKPGAPIGTKNESWFMLCGNLEGRCISNWRVSGETEGLSVIHYCFGSLYSSNWINARTARSDMLLTKHSYIALPFRPIVVVKVKVNFAL